MQRHSRKHKYRLKNHNTVEIGGHLNPTELHFVGQRLIVSGGGQTQEERRNAHFLCRDRHKHGQTERCSYKGGALPKMKTTLSSQ